MLVDNNAHLRATQQLGEQRLASLDRFAPQVAAVQLRQIERATGEIHMRKTTFSPPLSLPAGGR
jgi:hypothetical protein